MQYSGGVVMGPDNVSSPDFMTLEDMKAVDAQVPGIVASSPMLEFHDRIAVGNGISKDTMLLGVSPQYKEVRNLKLKAGRFFDDQDALTHAKVAVLVGPMADRALRRLQLRHRPDHLHPRHPLHRHRCLRRKHQHLRHLRDLRAHHARPLRSRPLLHRQRHPQGNLLLPAGHQPRSSPPPTQYHQDHPKSRHRPTSEYKAQTLTDILNTMATIADMLTIVLILASAITLIVSGVGIMNSMLANVQSRLKEIGIRKALGATSREIRLQFLTESVFLSLSGGLIGTADRHHALPLSVRIFTPFSIPINPLSAVIALATSVIVGVIFGTLPANRAAQLDPVATLKYE